MESTIERTINIRETLPQGLDSIINAVNRGTIPNRMFHSLLSAMEKETMSKERVDRFITELRMNASELKVENKANMDKLTIVRATTSNSYIDAIEQEIQFGATGFQVVDNYYERLLASHEYKRCEKLKLSVRVLYGLIYLQDGIRQELNISKGPIIGTNSKASSGIDFIGRRKVIQSVEPKILIIKNSLQK